MAKILFISDNFINESLGIMYISSYLKANRHIIQLTLLCEHKGIDSLLGFIKKESPDIIGFSVMTPQVDTFSSVTKIIKENIKCIIIWGGPHCIFMPEHVVENVHTDIICIGEGEDALLTLMNKLSANEDYSEIPNLWVKKEGKWLRNSIGCLPEDLDKFPFPDRELYYSKYRLLRNFSVKRLITQRGCPYECSYCFEPLFKNLHKGKGKIIRRHSVNYVIGQIRDITSKYPTGSIHFSDDTFTLNKDWVLDFMVRYKENIRLPFTCNISVLNIDEEIIKKIKDAGCSGVVFGLESGIETVRMGILNKKIPNKRYIEVARLLRKHKMRFVTNMIFCLPNETLTDAIESIRFGQSLKPYAIKANILKIYKGTNLSGFVLNNNLYEAVGEFTYKPKEGNNEYENIKNMIWAGHLFIKFPLLLYFARWILSGPLSKILKPLILLSYWEDVRFFKISLWQSLCYFWQSRKIFVEGIGKEQRDIYKEVVKR